MSPIAKLIRWIRGDTGVPKDTRLRCSQCINMVTQDFARNSSGLCEACVKINDATPRNSPYHDQLSEPVQDLSYEQKRTQLLGALRWQNEQRIDELFAVNDIDFFDEPPTNCHTWMNTAIFYGCGVSILQKLVSAGCKVYTPPKLPDPTCSLWLAIKKGDLEIVEWLLENGAAPNRSSALVAAIHLDDTESKSRTLELLFRYGANANRVFRLYGDETQKYTILDCETDPDIIQLLRSHNAKAYKDLAPRHDG